MFHRDLTEPRQLDRASQELGVGHETDLNEDVFELGNEFSSVGFEHGDVVLDPQGIFGLSARAFAVLLPVKSMGVTDDGRRHDPVIA